MSGYEFDDYFDEVDLDQADFDIDLGYDGDWDYSNDIVDREDLIQGYLRGIEDPKILRKLNYSFKAYTLAVQQFTADYSQRTGIPVRELEMAEIRQRASLLGGSSLLSD